MADTTNAQKYKGYDLDSNSSHRRKKKSTMVLESFRH